MRVSILGELPRFGMGRSRPLYDFRKFGNGELGEA